MKKVTDEATADETKAKKVKTKEITTIELNVLVQAGKVFTAQTPLSKLWFAVDYVTKIATKELAKVEKRREQKRREFAIKKEKGIYDLDKDGKWQFDDAGLDKLLAAMDVLDEEKVSIPVKIIPKGEYDERVFSYDIRVAFEGIVIPEIDHDYEIENFKEEKKEEKKPE